MRKKDQALLRFLDDQQKVSVREAVSYAVGILGLVVALAATYLAIHLT